MIAALSHIHYYSWPTQLHSDLICWLHHQWKTMCRSISACVQVLKGLCASDWDYPCCYSVDSEGDILDMAVISCGVQPLTPKCRYESFEGGRVPRTYWTCFGPVLCFLSVFDQKRHCRRGCSLTALVLVNCSRVRVHVSADFLTTAPCCMPAVAQGHINPYWHNRALYELRNIRLNVNSTAIFTRRFTLEYTVLQYTTGPPMK